MYRKIREAQQGDREEGFTLIELLVVVIIIGILAAIAIPVFLNQRKKAWDSAAKSDLRNAATAQESYFTDASKYTSSSTDLSKEGFKGSKNVDFSVVSSSATAYCMKAFYDADNDDASDTGKTWYLASTTGAPSETACT